MSWFLTALKKYAVFSGRAQRAEYWYFFLFYLLILIGLSVIDAMIGSFNTRQGMGILGSICTLGLLLPSLAVGVRRLHDTGRSGWWMFIGLIPLIGGIVLLIFTVQDSEPGENLYGPNPKELVA